MVVSILASFVSGAENLLLSIFPFMLNFLNIISVAVIDIALWLNWALNNAMGLIWFHLFIRVAGEDMGEGLQHWFQDWASIIKEMSVIIIRIMQIFADLVPFT